MIAAESWSCPNCGHAVATRHCPACGEHALGPRDLTLRHLALQVAHAFTNVDGRLIRSLVALVARPGALTVAFATGRRRPFLGPIPLFLMANVLYFAIQSLTGVNIFSTPLEMHLNHQPWSDAAQALVDGRLAATGATLEAFRVDFDHAVWVNGKSLIGLMVLPLALASQGLFARAPQPFAVHVVFAIHFYAFLLLLFSAPVAIVALGEPFGGPTTIPQMADDMLSVGLLIGCTAYLYVAIGRVFGARGWARAARGVALGLAAAAIFLGYRLAIFLITLATT